MSKDEAKARAPLEAVRRIGTNAVPFLVKWIQYEPGPMRGLADRVRPALPKRLREQSVVVDWVFRDAAFNRAELAVRGFKMLNPMGSNAVPDLERLLMSHSIGYSFAMDALAFTGREGWKVLASAMADPEHPHRDVVANYFGNVGTRVVGTTLGSVSADEVPRDLPVLVKSVAPIMVRCLEDKDEAIAFSAIEVLSGLRGDPEIPDWVLAAVEGALRHSDSAVRSSAAGCLCGYGERAQSAASSVAKLLNDPEDFVRTAATNALVKIAPELLGPTNVGRGQ